MQSLTCAIILVHVVHARHWRICTKVDSKRRKKKKKREKKKKEEKKREKKKKEAKKKEAVTHALR